MKWILGDGQTIWVWEDHWIPSGSLRSRIEGPLMPNEEQRLEDLQFPLPTHLEQLIKCIPVVQLIRLSDSLFWPQNNSVCLFIFASKLLYQQANAPFVKSLWRWIRKLHCPKKLQIFIWKSMHNQLPTRHYQAFSHPEIDNWCPRCNTLETTIHILRDCPWAKIVWCQSLGVLPLSLFQLTLQTWLQTNATLDTFIFHHQLPWKIYFPFLYWHLLLARNERIFNNWSSSQSRLVHKAVQLATKKILFRLPR